MQELHRCSKCGEEHPWSMFQLYKGHPNGQCRACKTSAMKEKRKQNGIAERRLSRIEDDKKLCMGCDEMKPLEEFSPAPRGLCGLSAYCRVCFNKRYAVSKEDACEATKRYRKLNRERHLANHRVRMFEYRTRKKVTSDGTATDEFLKGLYATSECHYCGMETPEEERTADHRIPLARDGAHSASNLVMACFSCNSAKRDMTDDEFIESRRIA